MELNKIKCKYIYRVAFILIWGAITLYLINNTNQINVPSIISANELGITNVKIEKSKKYMYKTKNVEHINSYALKLDGIYLESSSFIKLDLYNTNNPDILFEDIIIEYNENLNKLKCDGELFCYHASLDYDKIINNMYPISFNELDIDRCYSVYNSLEALGWNDYFIKKDNYVIHLQISKDLDKYEIITKILNQIFKNISNIFI